MRLFGRRMRHSECGAMDGVDKVDSLLVAAAFERGR
jgi:hypothetical protein